MTRVTPVITIFFRQVDACHSNQSFLATAPPRDVSIKLIHRALPIVPSETTLKVKKDAVLLLANIAEVDCTSTLCSVRC
jgi:hypothetical protein